MPGGIPLGYRTPRLADVYAAPGSSGLVTATLLRWHLALLAGTCVYLPLLTGNYRTTAIPPGLDLTQTPTSTYIRTRLCKKRRVTHVSSVTMIVPPPSTTIPSCPIPPSRFRLRPPSASAASIYWPCCLPPTILSRIFSHFSCSWSNCDSAAFRASKYGLDVPCIASSHPILP